ncbi:MAG TPA: accessory gene regulator B family protein [Syntrophomonadaceae bacterium]|nr:accessory gene regulator B family protein [Syntrophomonadaceae bacterium]
MARSLGNTLDSQESVEIYAYALQALLMIVLNLTLVVIAAFFLKIIPTTLAFLAVFIPFRVFGGGVHMSTFPRCIMIGSFLMLGSAYLAAEMSILPHQLALLCLFTLLLAFYSTVKWVPAGSEKSPIKDPGIVRMQKRNMLIAIVIWAGCVYRFIYSNNDSLASAMFLGAIVSIMLISPLGFYLMGTIDRILNKFGRRVLTHDA